MSDQPSHLQKLDAYVEKQKEKLAIDDIDLNKDFQKQAPNYIDECKRYHKAQMIVKQQKEKLSELEAQKYFEFKNGAEKTTEAMLNQAIKNDEDVKRQKNLIIQAEYQASVYQSLVRAWEQKKDMLIQVGSNQRAEMAGQVQINKPPKGNASQGGDPFDHSQQPANQL